MPRKPAPEGRKIGKVTEEAMKDALQEILQGKSIRHVSKEKYIPFATLYRYNMKMKAKGSIENIRLEPHYAVNKIFNAEQEQALKDYFEKCALMFYGLSTKDCRKVAYEMAVINCLKMPASWTKNQLAGIDWFKAFRKRHPELSLRRPEACSLARATAFNKHTVNSFFDNLHTVYYRYPCFADGTRVFNLDETATTTVQKPQRVIGPKGRNINKVTSGERGILVTTCLIICAAGYALPPVLIFPRKKFKDHMIKGAPPGTLGLATPTGWMNSETFVQTMAHFIKRTSSSIDNPSLLVMDNHESHLSIEALDLAKANGVTIITLHPHTTAKMQPLDVGINFPLKVFYNAEIDSWMMRNPGKPVTIYDLAELVGNAFNKAMTPTNIVNAFKKTGIFPFDRNIFSEDDFLPSSVTDRPDPELSVGETINIESDLGSPSILQNTPDLCHLDEIQCNEQGLYLELNNSEVQGNSSHQEEIQFNQPNLNLKTPPRLPLSEIQCVSPQPGCSRPTTTLSATFIKPSQFRPPIKAQPRKNTRKRKSERTMIATDTAIRTQKAESKKNKKPKQKPKKTVVRKVLSQNESDSEEDLENENISIHDEDSDWCEEDEIDIVPLTDEQLLNSILPRLPEEGDYVLAYERRFPSCPQIPVVVECVITDDNWTADDSQRTTTRRCQLNVEAPYLLKKMIGVDYIYFLQKNVLDLNKRVLEIEATNETFAARVGVVEKCKYYVHPENPDWTCFEMNAFLDVKNFFGLESTVEKIAMKQYAANIAKGKELIDIFMAEVYEDGVPTLKPWKKGQLTDNHNLRHALSHEPLSPSLSPQGSSSFRKQSGPDQDSDYIKRYLGELTPTQESRLLQLRKWIADLQKGKVSTSWRWFKEVKTTPKVPSDTTLLRFLRARDFNVEKAREMLSQSLLWRKKHQVDRILSEYETPDVVKQYFPGGWHHHDKDGRPLYILRLGQMDVKGLLKSIGEDGLLKLTLHVCEEGLKLLEEATNSSEHAVQSWCLLVDLDGLNMRHLWRPGVRALLRIIQIVEANYPETMGRVLIVRAPRVFPILWTIVSTFIDENTRSKFLFYGGKDYLQPGGLLDYIPKDLIPDFLGGPCKSFVHEGGLVPKSLYVSGAFTEREGDPLSEDSIYRSVSLGKGQVHEVIVPNRDPQSVLTWDFDVLRHDIAFTVYRSEHELSHPPADTSALCVGGGDEAKSVLDQKGWREGEHFHRVEPTLVCHDGESIQGSHVMLECGSYVLQWRCDMLDSTHRAAQLMYFHETLTSHHYKGSMSSLQSGTSGFSCLSGKSVASSCPSR